MFSETIQDARRKRGLSQAQLAELADVSRHTIINLESENEPDVKLSSLESVLRALGLRINITPRVMEPLFTSDENYKRAANQIVLEYNLEEDDTYEPL